MCMQQDAFWLVLPACVWVQAFQHVNGPSSANSHLFPVITFGAGPAIV